MILCDLCLTDACDLVRLRMFVKDDNGETLLAMHMCTKCKDEVRKRISDIPIASRKTLRDAIPSLTPDQQVKVSALVLRQGGEPC